MPPSLADGCAAKVWGAIDRRHFSREPLRTVFLAGVAECSLAVSLSRRGQIEQLSVSVLL
jgi:hypothetical protein